MKLKSTLFLVLVLLSCVVFATDPTFTVAASPTTLCSGDTITIAISTSDTFPAGNVFRIGLLDGLGDIANPQVIGSVASRVSDTVRIVIPTVPQGANDYYIGVLALSDTDLEISADSLSIHNTPVAGLQFPQSSYCTFTHTVILTGGTPAGGVYSGSYVQDSAFQSYLSGTGTFEVYYTVTTEGSGCFAVDSEALTINSCPAPSVSVQVSPSSLCPGSVMSINIQTTDIIGWDNIFTVQLSDTGGSFANPTVLVLDTNSSSTSVQIPTPAEPASSHYKVRVIASDPSTESLPVNVTFKSLLAPPNIKLDTTGSVTLCGNDSFKLKIDSVHGVSYQWTFNSFGLTVTKYSYEAKDSGLYIVNFTDTAVAGCSSGADSVFIGVYPYPAKPAVSPAGTTDLCGAGPVVLSTPSNNTVIFQWQNQGRNIAGATQNLYSADTSGVYRVEATSAQGCSIISNQAYVNIHASPIVTFNISLDSFCLHSAPILLSGGSPAGNGGAYSGTYVTNNATFNQTLSGVGSFEVYYTYTDTIGCHGTDSTKIHVYDCTTSGITELNGQHSFEMFPNPATTQIYIYTSVTGNYNMKLFNLLGQEMVSSPFNQQLTYSVEKLPAGVYLAEVSDTANTWRTVKRLIIQ